jgi:hypothetical protein
MIDPTKEQLLAARAEEQQVRELNRPWFEQCIARNRVIIENKACRAFFRYMLRGAPRQYVDRLAEKQFTPVPERDPLPPHRLSDAAREVIQAEERAMEELKLRTPDQWLEAVLALAPHQQYHAASVAWWDYFGKRISAERWPQLDGLIRHRDGGLLEQEELTRCLRAMGYTDTMATNRMEGKDDDNDQE